jgi:anti-anti-sigma regulatory factor
VSIEQYSLEVMIVATADESSPFKIYLRKEAGANLASDLRWLCEEYMDSHVILDLARVVDLDAATHRIMLDLRTLVEESDYRLVLCGPSPHVKSQLGRMPPAKAFDLFDTRKAAILELAPDEAHDSADPGTGTPFAIKSTPGAAAPATSPAARK